MKDGNYTIYVVQYRVVRKSPWSKPKEKLKPFKDKDGWSDAAFDSFEGGWEPHIGTGNSWRPKTPKSHDQLRDVQYKTGCSGYFTISYALRALKRLREADDKGMFDYFGPYKEHCQAVRHEFRLVTMVMSQETRVIDLAGVVEAL